MKRVRIQLNVTGKVQGVGYRISAKQQADHLSLTGWVQNQSNGTVEILAEGSQAQLDQFIKWAQSGPRFADVEQVTLKNLTTDTEYDDFSIR